MTGLRKPVLIAAVLVVAAVLAWLLWPSAAKPVTLRAATGPYTVQFAMPAPTLGANTATLEITGPDTRAVTVEPVMPQMGHALAPVPAEPESPGRYRVTMTLPMSGQWEITVTLNGTEHVVFPLLVNG
jgi:hypothetical protein